MSKRIVCMCARDVNQKKKERHFFFYFDRWFCYSLRNYSIKTNFIFLFPIRFGIFYFVKFLSTKLWKIFHYFPNELLNFVSRFSFYNKSFDSFNREKTCGMRDRLFIHIYYLSRGGRGRDIKVVGWILAIVGMIGRFRQRLIDQTIRDDSAFAFTFHKIVPDRSITFEEARAALRNRTSTRERERGFALLSASHHRSCLLQSRDCIDWNEHVGTRCSESGPRVTLRRNNDRESIVNNRD